MSEHIKGIALVAWAVSAILTILFIMSCDLPDDDELP